MMTVRTVSHADRFGWTFPSLADRARLMLRRRSAYKRTFGELAACSDRDLADLGIARADIRRLATEAADRAA